MDPLEWQFADALVNGFFEYLFAYKCCVVNGSGSCTTDVSFDFECISILLLTMCYDFVERIIPLSVPSALQAVRLSVFTGPEALFRQLPGSLNNSVKYFQQFQHDTYPDAFDCDMPLLREIHFNNPLRNMESKETDNI
jgi:hypothetical protein